MTKELTPLEALDRLYSFIGLENKNPIAYLIEQENLSGYKDIIETALKNYEDLTQFKMRTLTIDETKQLMEKHSVIIDSYQGIPNKLKALEIIKEKRVSACNCLMILNGRNDDLSFEDYNKLFLTDLTKEEYSLLKEVLL